MRSLDNCAYAINKEKLHIQDGYGYVFKRRRDKTPTFHVIPNGYGVNNRFMKANRMRAELSTDGDKA